MSAPIGVVVLLMGAALVYWSLINLGLFSKAA